MFLHRNRRRQTKRGSITAGRSLETWLCKMSNSGVPACWCGWGRQDTYKTLVIRIPPEFKNSTPLAARLIQAIRVWESTQGGELQEIDPDQLDQILADTVATGVPPFAANITIKLPVQE